MRQWHDSGTLFARGFHLSSHRPAVSEEALERLTVVVYLRCADVWGAKEGFEGERGGSREQVEEAQQVWGCHRLTSRTVWYGTTVQWVYHRGLCAIGCVRTFASIFVYPYWYLCVPLLIHISSFLIYVPSFVDVCAHLCSICAQLCLYLCMPLLIYYMYM